MFKNIDWFKVFFSLMMGVLLGLVQCAYTLTVFRHEMIHITIELLGLLWLLLSMISAYIFYSIVVYIEKRLV